MANTLKDPETDELNPAETIARGLTDRERAISDQMGAELRDDTSPEGESLRNAADELADREGGGGSTPNEMNYVRGKDKKHGVRGDIDREKFLKRFTFARKVVGKGKIGGIIALIAMFGVTGGILASFLGPASLVINAAESFAFHNDSASTAMERRLLKVFSKATKEDVPASCKTVRTLKCKLGSISIQALQRLAGNDITPTGVDLTDTTSKYPDNNPSSYEIETGGGKKTTVNAPDMGSYLVDSKNSAVANRVAGRNGGAFNMRWRAWSGKHMTDRFYNIFHIKRDGGNAKKEFTDLEKEELHKKAQETIPDNSKTKQATATAESSIKKNIKKVDKAGTVYTVAYGYCTAIDARKYVLMAVAAAELAQLLPVVENFTLSPAAMAEGSDAGSGFSGEAMTAVGTLLTDERPDSTGKVSAPVNSKYYLKAMGVNTGRVPIPEKFSSIFKVLNSDIYKAADTVGDATEDECKVIESPGAMYTATAVDAAATLYGPYGALKVIGSFALDPIISFATSKIAAFGLQALVDQLVEKDYISEAQGEELGDVIGIAATAFFAAGATSRLLPSVSVSNVRSARAVEQENEEFQRQMAVAALSPFDTSSRYTFLGSILFNIRSGMLVNGYYNNSFSSILSTIANLPSLALSIPKVSADMLNDDDCNEEYAIAYGKDTGDPTTTPATSYEGSNCHKLTEYQANMDEDAPVEAMVNEGWIVGYDTEVVEENASIADLVSSGIIVPDTPLAEYIDSCGDASSDGSFLDPSSCIMNPAEGGDLSTLDSQASDDCINDVCYSDVGVKSQVTGPKDPNSLAAIPVFLLDYQINAAINGEDPEETGELGNDATSTASGTIVDGTVQELARLVAENENISFVNENTRADLLQIASGQSVTSNAGTPMVPDKALLQTILYMAGSYSMLINNIGWSNERFSESASMPHPSGHAIDLNGISSLSSGQSVNVTFSSDQMSLINSFANDWITGASQAGGATVRMGQLGCGGFDVSSKVTQFKDECNHLHIEAFGGG